MLKIDPTMPRTMCHTHGSAVQALSASGRYGCWHCLDAAGDTGPSPRRWPASPAAPAEPQVIGELPSWWA